MGQNPNPPDLYLWSNSQEDDVDQILVLIEAWQQQHPKHARMLCNPYRIMDVTQDVFSGLLAIYSEKNVPSPIKKAAYLCHAVAQRRPLRTPDRDTPYCDLIDGAINAIMGFDFAALYLHCSMFVKNGGTEEAKEPIAFPSVHFALDFLHRLAEDQINVMGTSLTLELLLYKSNPNLVGIIDDRLKDRLKTLVAGFDLYDFYRDLIDGLD